MSKLFFLYDSAKHTLYPETHDDLDTALVDIIKLDTDAFPEYVRTEWLIGDDVMAFVGGDFQIFDAACQSDDYDPYIFLDTYPNAAVKHYFKSGRWIELRSEAEAD